MHSHFVDREEQIEFIKDLLKDLSTGIEPRHRIIEYYGVAGVGKTALLRQVQSLCTEAEIPCLYFDFSSGVTDGDEEIALLRAIVLETIGDASPEALGFTRIVEEYNQARGQEKDKKDFGPELCFLSKRIATEFLRCLRGHMLVLLLDSVDRASARALAFLEREILVQLVSSSPIVAILASRRRIGWTSYSMKRLLLSQRLAPLSREDSAKHMESMGRSECADEIYEITNGHPMSNSVVKDLLDQIEIAINRRIKCEDFGDYECRLVKALEEEVVQNQIMQAVDLELYPIFRVLSIPRRLNIAILAKVLGADMPSLSWDLDESHTLLERLRSTGLVQWSEGMGDYTLDSTTRLVLSLDMRFSNPDKYLEITKALVNHYEQEFEERLEPRAAVEALYHLADQFRIEDQRYDVEIASGQIHRLQDWLTPVLGRMEQEKGALLSRLEELRNRVMDDEDLLARIGYREEIDVLTETIDNFIEKARITKRILLTIEKHYGVEQYGIKFEVEGEAVPLPTMGMPVPSSRELQLMSLVRTARSADDLRRIGALVYTQFLPIPFQNRLRLVRDPITILVNEPEIPWELLHDSNEFVFLRVPVGRRILTLEESKRTQARRGRTLRFLLVGVAKPAVKVPESSIGHFEPIPDVVGEIKSVVAQLEDSPAVDFNAKEDLLIDEDATGSEFLLRLASGDYDVIHFAGHAYESEERSHNALVLYDELLSGANLANTIQGRPLVFLNGCRTAAAKSVEIKGNYIGKIMIGLAHAFTLGGALACVGNLWRISDVLSTEFALIFYRHMLSGQQSVGEAMRQARIELRERGYSQSLAWASYVLYGDPTMRLFRQ